MKLGSFIKSEDFKSDLTNVSEQEVKKAISDCLHYARTVLVAREAMNKKTGSVRCLSLVVLSTNGRAN